MARSKPIDAIAFFSDVKRLYPYSEWPKRSVIMQAFANHKAKQYEEARDAAERYIEYYPSDEDSAYAQYIIALSYYDQIEDIGRDQEVTAKALEAFTILIKNYPDSEYVKPAELKFDLAFDHLAGKEMEGKERKGKERKGKERKGKERKRKRKGKERKGKERKGLEANPFSPT